MTMETVTSAILLLLAAMSSLATMYLSVWGKNASARTLVVFSTVLFLLTALPNIEVFKGWGLETRIREQVRDARDVLTEIKSISATFAVQSCISLGNNILVGLTPPEDILAAASEVDKLLIKINGPSYDFTEARGKFNDMIAVRAGIYTNDFVSKFVDYDLLKQNPLSDNPEAGDASNFAQKYKYENFTQIAMNNYKLRWILPENKLKIYKFASQLEAEMKEAVKTNKFPKLLSSLLSNNEFIRRDVIEKWIADNT